MRIILSFLQPNMLRLIATIIKCQDFLPGMSSNLDTRILPYSYSDRVKPEQMLPGQITFLSAVWLSVAMQTIFSYITVKYDEIFF